jgi:hypothetical protein
LSKKQRFLIKKTNLPGVNEIKEKNGEDARASRA